MANIGLVFFLLALVLFSKVEARPVSASPILPTSNPNLTTSSIPVTSSSNGASLSKTDEDDDVACKGLSSEDCLMRRSTVAHIDYIYTQDVGSSTQP